jgi:squalene-hopene/tetraprenyl-beta-curcumene cyclase
MTLPADTTGLQATIAVLRERLLAARGPQGYWEGRLSSSALSTATAVFALAVADREKHSSLIDRGLQWLCQNCNADGGWGDTIQSPSNLSTTMLCYSAFAIADFGLRISDSQQAPTPIRNPKSEIRNAKWAHTVCKTESWLHQTVGSLEPEALAKAVERQYGKDRTFSVPILTMCALAGRLGTGAQAWRMVRPLPFELAVLPHRLYKWLRLPVVSYALPALIAIGQARYEHRKPRNPLIVALRRLSRARSLAVLTRLQPENGGFLEAAPLTSFVVMSLAASGHKDHQVVSKGVEFLTASVREDGSWPIDTNLATWVTTLSISALSNGGFPIADCRFEAVGPIRDSLTEWLLSCQHRDVHPYTRAEPGGWAWSHLPGAVPDADDTSGALLALRDLSWQENKSAIRAAVSAGIEWLLGLQNADGGIPTFCRGWTKLPFDKSSPDITAHALGAMGVWLEALPRPLRCRTEKAMGRAVRYLWDAQRTDGAWVPLWFGNQHAPNRENPVYGTSRALTHLSRLPEPYASHIAAMRDKAVRWLLSVQNADGGWGGAGSVVSSIEETALAVDGLCSVVLQSAISDPKSAIEPIRRGAEWLMRNTEKDQSTTASPIGLYFARLWYFEELYPVVFALSALGKVSRLLDHTDHD